MVKVISKPVLQEKEKAVVEAYCIKCKSRHNIVNGERINMKNGRLAYKGICDNCKKIVCTLIKKDSINNN